MIKDALKELVSAKTLTLWLILAGMALFAFVLLVAVDIIWGKTFDGYFNSTLEFLGLAGGGGTARNVISDGVMPRIPMAVGARSDPSVATQSPQPMVKAGEQLTQPTPNPDPPKHTGSF